jgi:hypothetical protein
MPDRAHGHSAIQDKEETQSAQKRRGIHHNHRTIVFPALVSAAHQWDGTSLSTVPSAWSAGAETFCPEYPVGFIGAVIKSVSEPNWWDLSHETSDDGPKATLACDAKLLSQARRLPTCLLFACCTWTWRSSICISFDRENMTTILT